MSSSRLSVRPQKLSNALRYHRTCTCQRVLPQSSRRHGSTTMNPPSTSSPASPNQPPTQTSASALQSGLDADSEYSSFSIPNPTPSQTSSFDPLARAKSRETQLPPSRYRYRSPRYYRGPLHPHQPPPPSDPTSRLFIPGPFSLPRLAQTWKATVSHDLMVLTYEHVPPGTPKPPPLQRLRTWDDSSPYFKNRPLRAPRGTERLPLLVKPINFRNVPTLEAITVSILVREATQNSAYLHAAGILLQSITSQRATVYMAKTTSSAGHRRSFAQRQGKPIAVGTTMQGEMMWHFFSTFVGIVLPRVKEWGAVKAKGGDRSGNFTIGLPPEAVEGWPEVAVNYDAYPPQMIPGLDVTLTTTATNDRDGKLLLAGLGIPFNTSGR